MSRSDQLSQAGKQHNSPEVIAFAARIQSRGTPLMARWGQPVSDKIRNSVGNLKFWGANPESELPFVLLVHPLLLRG